MFHACGGLYLEESSFAVLVEETRKKPWETGAFFLHTMNFRVQ